MAIKLCSFACLRWSLIILNIFYITLGVILIGLAIASKTLAYFTEPHILIGTAICGTILVLIAIFGLIGAARHNQVILFFYMIILGVSLLLMFAVSVAALVTPPTLQQQFLANTWVSLSDKDKTAIQNALDCCGFNNITQDNQGASHGDQHPSCKTVILTKPGMCCSNSPSNPNYNGQDDTCPHCTPCYDAWKNAVDRTIRLSGGFGLVFSFTQIIGIVLTFRYRNEKDPFINPRAIL